MSSSQPPSPHLTIKQPINVGLQAVVPYRSKPSEKPAATNRRLVLEASAQNIEAVSRRDNIVRTDDHFTTLEKIDQLLARVDSLAEDNGQLTAQVNRLAADNGQLTAQVNSLAADNGQLTIRVNDLDMDNEDMARLRLREYTSCWLTRQDGHQIAHRGQIKRDLRVFERFHHIINETDATRDRAHDHFHWLYGIPVSDARKFQDHCALLGDHYVAMDILDVRADWTHLNRWAGTDVEEDIKQDMIAALDRSIQGLMEVTNNKDEFFERLHEAKQFLVTDPFGNPF